MCSEPFSKDRNGIAIWIELLLRWHEVSNVHALVIVSIADGIALHHEFPKHSRILFFGFLQPECKAQPLFCRYLAVGICRRHGAAVYKKWTPSAVSSRRCLQLPVSGRNQLMELSLTRPFPLGQFLEPAQVLPCEFGTASNSIADEFKDELHAFQRWIEAHQQERIELRLECISVYDLVIA